MSGLIPRASLAERGMVLLVTSLCTLVVAAAAGTGLWLRSSADDLAASLFESASYGSTQLQVTYTAVTNDALPPTVSDRVEEALAPPLAAFFDPPRALAVTTEMAPDRLPRRPGEPAFLSVAGMTDPEPLVDVVEGRLPRPGSAVRTLPPRIAASYDGPADSAVVEVVLEESAAVEMELPVGSWVALDSPTYRGDVAPPAVLRVVGTFRGADPAPTALDDVTALRKPNISVQPEFNLVRATALAADVDTVLGAPWLGDPSVLVTFDPAGTPAAGDAEVLVEEGRQVQLQDWPPAVEAAGVGAATGIADLAQDVVDQRRTSDGLIVLTATALATGALAVLLAAATVLGGRRTPVTAVVRARGASGRWLVLRRGAEALAMAIPGVAVGLAGVWLASGSTPSGSDLAVVAAAAAACVVVVTAAQVVPRSSGDGQLQAVVADALQVVAVVLAGGATALVLVGGALAPGDPLLLALPLLVGAASAVVTVRLLQVGLVALRRVARRSRSVSPVVSLTESVAVARQVVVASTAMVLAVAAAVLAVSATDTLRRGAELAGWEQVGADVGILAGGLDDEDVDRLAALPGVSTVAPVFSADSTSFSTRTGVEGVQLVGVDPAALARVGDGSLSGLDLAPTADGTLTGVASPDLSLDDDRGLLRYAQSQVDVEVVDRVDSLPGISQGGSFLLVDVTQLEEATDRDLGSYEIVLLGGSPDMADVVETVRRSDPQAIVTSRAGITAEHLEAPAVARTLSTLTVALAVAGALAAFAVLLTAALGAPSRRRVARVLAAIGADAGAARRIGVWSLVPIVVASVLAAAASGLLLTAVAGGGFDLAALSGTRDALAVRPDLLTALAIAAGLAGLVLLAVLAARAGHRPPATDRPDPEPR
ncbi:hypothetical protein [Nocardioides euryhalodurans]|uniref:hypothetical protein n=1 Tax=Nocardioides euryhalodurans TaxID=2518370 RepID=UPI001ABEC1C5|nr:hypothetical protein [Nocardioides euryhalodurans]